MKVGDYVRTKYGIALIENIRDDIRRINLKTNEIYFDYEYQLDKCIIYSVDEGSSYFCRKEDIIKSSPRIIDLIQVGDYVNGFKVKADENGELFYHRTVGYEIIKDCEIKSIVTKEQFESMEYKVGE